MEALLQPRVATHRDVLAFGVVVGHGNAGDIKLVEEPVQLSCAEDPVERLRAEIAGSRVLRKISDRSRALDGAGSRQRLARKDAGEGGLACPVSSHEAHPVAGRDLEGRRLEQLAAPYDELRRFVALNMTVSDYPKADVSAGFTLSPRGAARGREADGPDSGLPRCRIRGGTAPRRAPVALVGSGEFLDVMVPVDDGLLADRPARAVFLPTAAAEEGEGSVSYWVELGRRHFERLGVEPVPLLVLDRTDADSPRACGPSSGCRPRLSLGRQPRLSRRHAARDTLVWAAILEAWRTGTALAGCSAGACALSPRRRLRRDRGRAGHGPVAARRTRHFPTPWPPVDPVAALPSCPRSPSYRITTGSSSGCPT